MDRNLELKHEVLDELEFDPTVDAAEIGVTAKDGVVTLSYAEKLAAEDAAKRVRGVKAVAMDIEVQLPTTTRRTDADIAAAALTAFGWNAMVPRDRVKVKVEDGWVTLDGEVTWGWERESAGQAVRFLNGVRGVTNLIAVKPRIATQPIKERIVGAFRRSAELDAKTIRVDALDSKVTLTGTVHSWNERSAAERVAWAAPGVAHVENRIVIAA